MPHRAEFLRLLARYHPTTTHEAHMHQQMTSFVQENSDCFLRTNLSGHITGSCWLVSPDEASVLLTHHKKIGRWLQLGGHADGDADLLRVAMTEAREESGIDAITALSPAIFDIDIHEINEHKGVPRHLHYDVRFMLKAATTQFAVSDESHDLAWVLIDEIASSDTFGETLQRMATKWLAYKRSLSLQ